MRKLRSWATRHLQIAGCRCEESRYNRDDEAISRFLLNERQAKIEPDLYLNPLTLSPLSPFLFNTLFWLFLFWMTRTEISVQEEWGDYLNNRWDWKMREIASPRLHRGSQRQIGYYKTRLKPSFVITGLSLRGAQRRSNLTIGIQRPIEISAFGRILFNNENQPYVNKTFTILE